MIRDEACATLVDVGISIRDSLQRLCDSAKGVLFLVDGGILKGSLSDGDVRRHLLAGGGIDDQARVAANLHPKFLFTTERGNALSLMVENKISAIPIVDENMCVIDVAFLRESVPLDDVVIRELKSGDMGLVLEFFDQMAGDTRAMFNRGDVNRVRVIRHFGNKQGTADGEIHFAAIVKDGNGCEKMVGYVFLWGIDTRIPWLGIAVREEWKGHQLGRRLLEYVDQWAIPRGYGGIKLTSVPANIRAHSLYVRMGYQYYGVYTDSEFLYIKCYPLACEASCKAGEEK